MAGKSESSFGNKLNNAQALSTNIQSLVDYKELNDELTIEKLNARIQELLINNNDVANKLQSYSMTIDAKQKIFTKDKYSITKSVTPIWASVRSIFGKNSKEAQNIGYFATKIRGVKVIKSPIDAAAHTISQSERSYGTILQTFSDLITTLETFGINYSPANMEFSTIDLQQKRDLATQLNTKSIKEYGELKIAREKRNVKYKELSQLCFRFKDTVKSQYGTQSVEYKLVKGLKV